MRVLFATGRMLYPFFRGGDGTTIHQLLKALSEKNIISLACGKLNPIVNTYSEESVIKKLKAQKIDFFKTKNGITYNMVYQSKLFYEKYFEKSLKESIKEFKPDIILTQLEDSHIIITLAVHVNIPVVLYVHDGTRENLTSLKTKGLNHVFFNSKFIAKKYSHIVTCSSSIVYPFFDPSLYIIDKRNPIYITMINPTINKGYKILEQLLIRLPNLPFQIVSGWNNEIFNNINRPNIHKVPFSNEMKTVYSNTKMIIVPSQWEEPFCRIPIEAGLNGIPTIASKIGGLPESVGKGGILIEDFKSISKWQNQIISLFNDNEKTEKLGQLAYNNAADFVKEEILDSIISKFHEVIWSHKQG